MPWNPTNWLAAVLVGLSPAAAQPDLGKPAVVLVHGIYDSGDKMKWLAHRFELAGYETFCPSLTPSNGAISLEASAAQLDSAVLARFGNKRSLHIVGVSMGGLISRYWLAHYPARQRVVSYATLSAPHQGTIFAYINSKPGVIEMRPGSVCLRELASHDIELEPLQPLSLYTPLDLIILPANSSRWAVATNETRWVIFHPLMVFSPGVARRLLDYIRKSEE